MKETILTVIAVIAIPAVQIGILLIDFHWGIWILIGFWSTAGLLLLMDHFLSRPSRALVVEPRWIYYPPGNAEGRAEGWYIDESSV